MSKVQATPQLPEAPDDELPPCVGEKLWQATHDIFRAAFADEDKEHSHD